MHVCMRGGGEHRAQRFRHAEHLHSELGGLGAFDSQAQEVAAAVDQHARVLLDLHAQRVEEHHGVYRL